MKHSIIEDLMAEIAELKRRLDEKDKPREFPSGGLPFRLRNGYMEFEVDGRWIGVTEVQKIYGRGY